MLYRIGCILLGAAFVCGLWGVALVAPAGATLAWGTRLAVPGDGVKRVEKFKEGDQVLAGESTSGPMKWIVKTVHLSTGTGCGHRSPQMIHLKFGKDGSIIASADLLFLLPSGKLKRADRLAAGRDSLVGPDGAPIAVTGAHPGKWEGGFQCLATDADRPESPDGHLLLTNGVVSGDHALELSQEDLAEYMEEGGK